MIVALVVGAEAEEDEEEEATFEPDCFKSGEEYSPYPPSNTLINRPPQQISAIFMTSVVVQAKSSGLRSMPIRDGAPVGKCLILPTSPAAVSKPIDSSINDGLKARRLGINRCSIA